MKTKCIDCSCEIDLLNQVKDVDYFRIAGEYVCMDCLEVEAKREKRQ